VRAEALERVMHSLQREPEFAFEMLMDLTCVDRLPATPRFELVYHLYSVTHGHRLRVKARPEGDVPALASLAALWPSADWMEREAWDLYGVRFRGHPDLRRLLLDDAFAGHPLRKDYPKAGRPPREGPGRA
jgi:NADH-quinone oxidoreductase subunit C